MIYLSSPYSHPDPEVREQRFRAACEAVAYMMREGKQQVFSAIAHTHPLVAFGLPGGFEFWGKFDRWFIERCVKLVVLVLPGWEESKGVRAEMKIAVECGIPISYINPQPPVSGEEGRE